MNGYLHNLVMRSMGVAETVQPRLASLFEPPVNTAFKLEQKPYAPATGLAQDVSEDERSAPLSSSEVLRPASLPTQRAPLREASLSSTPVTNDAPPAPESARPSSPRMAVEKPQPKTLDTNHAVASDETRATLVPPPLSPPATARELQAERAEAQPVTQRDSLESSQAHPSLLAQVLRSAHAPLPAETIRVPERTMLTPPVQSTRDATEASPYADEQEQPREASQREATIERVRALHEETQTVIREVSQRTVERALLIERPPVVLPDEHSTIRERAPEKPAPLPLRPRISPYTEERRTLLDETQPERQPEPVIHVSIGRIEVRAITQQERPLQRAAAKPAESLEDYLRQRAKGGSR